MEARLWHAITTTAAVLAVIWVARAFEPARKVIDAALGRTTP